MNGKSSTGQLSPEYVFLGLLGQSPAHGYELHKIVKRDLGQVWHISLSQTYNILTRLEAQGFISSTRQEQDKLPPRYKFSLTPKGAEHFQSWLKLPSGSSGRAIRIEFLTRMYFAQQVNYELVRKLLDAQMAEVRSGLERLHAQRNQIPSNQVINALSLDLRIRQLSSILIWLEECAEKLTAPGGQASDEGPK